MSRDAVLAVVWQGAGSRRWARDPDSRETHTQAFHFKMRSGRSALTPTEVAKLQPRWSSEGAEPGGDPGGNASGEGFGQELAKRPAPVFWTGTQSKFGKAKWHLAAPVRLFRCV